MSFRLDMKLFGTYFATDLKSGKFSINEKSENLRKAKNIFLEENNNNDVQIIYSLPKHNKYD